MKHVYIVCFTQANKLEYFKSLQFIQVFLNCICGGLKKTGSNCEQDLAHKREVEERGRGEQRTDSFLPGITFCEWFSLYIIIYVILYIYAHTHTLWIEFRLILAGFHAACCDAAV